MSAMPSCTLCLVLINKGQLVAIRALIWEAQVLDMLLKLLKREPHKNFVIYNKTPNRS